MTFSLTKTSGMALVIGATLALASLFMPLTGLHAQEAGTPPPTADDSGMTTVSDGSGSDGSDTGWDMGSATIGVILSPLALISYVIFAVAKGLLWVSGVVLNFAVFYLVFEFSKHLGTSPGMLIGWSILRDLGNILLLFGFLSIGLQTILNVGHQFSAGKALSQLVLFAALLNFSLFAAGAVIDISNGLTLALFSQNAGYNCDDTPEKCLNDGITGQIAQQADLLTVVGGGGVGGGVDLGAQLSSYADKPLETILQFLLLALIVSMAAAVLFAAGLLLITRGITLAFLLITSPIGFAGMAVEPLKGMAKKWWSTLINNALFAPAFFILLFISLRMTDGLAGLMSGTGGLAGAVTSGGIMDAGPIFFFILVIGFMIAALVVGKQFGIMGADYAVKAGTMMGSAPFIPLRNTLSWASDKGGKVYEQRVAGAIRKIPVFGKDIETVVGAGVGKTFEAGKNASLPGWGTKPGWDETVKKRGEHLEHAKHEAHVAHEFDAAVAAYSKGDKEVMKKFLHDTSDGDLKKLDIFKKGGPALNHVVETMGASAFQKLVDDPKIPEKVKDQAKTARSKKVETEFAAALSGNADKMEKFMRDTSVYDLKGSQLFKEANPKDPNFQRATQAMSLETFKKFTDDQSVPNAVRSKTREARYQSLDADLATVSAGGAGADDAKKRVQERFTGDLEASGFLAEPTKRQQLVSSISDRQYEQLRSKEGLGSATRAEMEEVRYGYRTGSRFDTANIDKTLREMRDRKEITKVSAKTLGQPHVLRKLLPQHFGAIATSGRLSDTEKAPLVVHVQNLNASGDAAWMAYYNSLRGGQKTKVKEYYNLP